MKYIIGLFLISISLHSCTNSGCSPFGSFADITERDDKGKLIKQDENDWTLKDHWSDNEKALFDTTYKTNCFPPSHFAIQVYPNPTNGPFQVSFSKTAATRIDLRLVDEDCNIISYQDGLATNSIGMHAGSKVKKGLVRL